MAAWPCVPAHRPRLLARSLGATRPGSRTWASNARLLGPRAERGKEATLAGGWRQVPGTALHLRPLGRSPCGVEETESSSPVLTWRTW